MVRATQGVRLINLAKKNDVISSVCKVMTSNIEALAEEESKNDWNQTNEVIIKGTLATQGPEEFSDNEEK